MDRVAGLVFCFVVDRLKAFLLNGDVVDIPNRNEDTPNTFIVGHDGFREGRVVVALNGDVHLRQTFTKAGCAVVVEVPVDLSTDFHLKGGVHRVQNQAVVYGRLCVERFVAGVHEPRFGADGSVQVQTPLAGHQQLG